MPPVDRPALLRGAVVAVAVCLPVALFADAVIDEDDPSAWAVPLYLAVLAGFVVAGWVASRAATVSPLVTGALAALAGFVVVQGIGIVVALADDGDVGWSSIVLTALLAYGSGLTGAVAGERRRARR